MVAEVDVFVRWRWPGIPESRMDFGCEQVDTDDEATIDWLTEEAASYESGDGSDARSDDSEIKV